MDCSTNLKRRRDSGDSNKEGEKKNVENSEKNHSPSHNYKHLPSHKPVGKKQNPSDELKSFHPHIKKYPNSTYRTPLSPTPPSLSPPSSPRRFYRSNSETRAESPTPSTSKTHSRAKSVAGRDRQPHNAFYFCSDIQDSPIIDHQIKRLSYLSLH